MRRVTWWRGGVIENKKSYFLGEKLQDPQPSADLLVGWVAFGLDPERAAAKRAPLFAGGRMADFPVDAISNARGGKQSASLFKQL